MLKLLLLTGCLLPMALALPVFTGTVHDQEKQPIDGARITVWNGAEKSFSGSTSMGAFSIADISEGDYLFRVEAEGHLPLYGAIHLAGDDPHKVSIVMLDCPVPDTNVVGAAARLRYAIRPAPGKGRPPKITPAEVEEKVTPVYPESVPRSNPGGVVTLAGIILPAGKLDDLVVIAAPNKDFAESALVAVRQWEYSPKKLGDKAVESTVVAHVKYGH